jgi:ribosomal protein S18 acetylase RimI-like enzyme
LTINQTAGTVKNFDRSSAVPPVRRATSEEKAEIVPFFATLPRLDRPPEVYVDAGADEAGFVLGLLPDSRIRFHERDYFLELLLAEARTADIDRRVRAAIDALAGELGADHIITAYLDDDSAECRLLQAIGFQVEARHYRRTLAREAFQARFERLSRRPSAGNGGYVIVPYAAVDEREGRRLHEEVLGILPDGHYVLHGELESERDYTHSRALVANGRCIGAIISGVRGDAVEVESLALLPEHQGGALASRLLLAEWADLPAVPGQHFLFHVTESNRRTLRMVDSLGARPAGEQLRLVWSREVLP